MLLQKAASWTGLKLDKPIHDLNEPFVYELPLPILEVARQDT